MTILLLAGCGRADNEAPLPPAAPLAPDTSGASTAPIGPTGEWTRPPGLALESLRTRTKHFKVALEDAGDRHELTGDEVD